MFVTAGLLFPKVSAAQRVAEQQLTLRIHDYARVGPKVLLRAQSLVSDSYRSIGVRTAWAETLHPFSDREGPTRCAAMEDLTIIVLSARMAERTRLPKDAVGCAVVGRGGGGRVAYILYDRVAASAIQADWDAGDFMAVVVAHEVGHLLLPIGSHSPDGLMRGQWDLNDLRRTDPRALSFTPRQAELIRDTLGVVALPAAPTAFLKPSPACNFTSAPIRSFCSALLPPSDSISRPSNFRAPAPTRNGECSADDWIAISQFVSQSSLDRINSAP
jgi:hypothetical protein